MEFGVSIPNYGAHVSAKNLREWATLSESLGFQYAMVTDHIAQTPDVRVVYGEEFLEIFTALTYIASVTSTIKIGTTVVVLPLRHPINTARTVAAIDQLSDGRVVLGIGVGGASQEYSVLGVPFSQRGAIADEYLEVLAILWNSNEPVSYHGRFINFDDVLSSPSPAQQGGPDIWVGGGSDAALRRAAQHAAWHPTFPELDDLITHRIPRLHTLADKLGRPAPAIRPRIHLEIHEQPVHQPKRPAGVGSTAQIKEDLRRLQEAGIAAVIFDPVKHPAIRPDAPASRTPDRDLIELDQIRLAAAEIVDLETGAIRP